MPTLIDHIRPGGPLVPLAVLLSTPRVNALKRAGLWTPTPPFHCTGLIDTGASSTVMDPEIVKRLGLVATGTTPIITPSTGSTPVQCNQYDICLAFTNPKVHIQSLTMPAIEAELAFQGFHVLIGRDVLEKCILTYNGPQGIFSLEFDIPNP